MGVSDQSNDENRVGGSKHGVSAQGYAKRALGFVIPAYWGAVRAHGSSSDHPASAWERATYAAIGGIGGALLSGMVSVIVGAMWEREAVLASAPDLRYTLHAQPRAENNVTGIASMFVSPVAYAAFLSRQPMDITARLEVTSTDGAHDRNVEARCRYPVSIDRDALFDVLRDDPPIVTLDSLGRPDSLMYGGQTVQPGSRIGRTIEDLCAKTLEENLEALNLSIR